MNLRKSRFILFSNLILLLAASLLVATGLTLELKIGENATATHLGLGREEWGEFHFFTALVVIGATLLHLIANFWWLRQTYTRWKLWTLLVTALAVLPTAVFLLA